MDRERLKEVIAPLCKEANCDPGKMNEIVITINETRVSYISDRGSKITVTTEHGTERYHG